MLHPSPTNPRKTFAEEPLQELAESIKQHGIMQPIVVREMPEAMRLQLGTEARLEIVAGERRWRAANIAGLPTVPVLLRDLTDEQVIALQIIENLQREGLSAIEEAEGYEVLRRQGMTAAQIADTVDKSKAYIHAKLKLLALCPEGRDKLRAGELSESIALLVARVPASLQARAVARVCEIDYSGNRPSVRSAANILQHHFTERLYRAHFAQDDETLIPHAGACTNCPKRLDDDADVCTDPICFKEKQELHYLQRRATAVATGQKIIGGAEAKTIKPHVGVGHLEEGYVLLDAKCYELDEYPTYRSLTEQVVGAVDVLLLDSPHTDDGLVEIVKKIALSEALRGAGVVLHVRDTEKGAKEAAKAEAERQADNQFRTRLFHEVRSQPLLMLSTPDLRLMAHFCISRLYEDTRFKVAKLYYPEEKNRVAVERLQERVENMDDSELIGLLRDTLLIGETRRETWQTDPPWRLLEAAARIGIDPDHVRAKVEKEAAMAGRIYRDPGNPELTWDGKGRKPLWLSIPEEAGRDIADFLVAVEPAKKTTKVKGAKK
jgi:ParB/RepB/Spo0J family partition protein